MAPVTYSPPVAALLQAGEKHLRLHRKWVNYDKIYGLTVDHIPELIQMAILKGLVQQHPKRHRTKDTGKECHIACN